ncbi:MAG: lysylphosphatidylglycerol synthase transmembrane domain-containing protein [Candidatus Micrarchaeota archaeon]
MDSIKPNLLLRLVPLLLGIALLFVLFAQTDFSIFNELSNANVLGVLIAIALVLVTLLFRGIKWNYILGFYGVKQSNWRATQVFCMGTMVGFWTPLKLGIFVRALYVKPLALTKSTASILIDRLTDILLVVIMAIILFSFFLVAATFEHAAPPLEGVFLVLIIIAVGILAFLLQSKTVIGFLEKVFSRLIPFSKLRVAVTQTFDEIGAYLSSPKRAALVLGLGALGFVSTIGYYFFTAFALHVSIPFTWLSAMVALTILIETIPVTALGFGTREGAWLLASPILQITPSQAVALPLLATLINYATLSVIGLSLSFEKKDTKTAALEK